MLYIGWATREFTPDRPALLQGQMHIRIAREALDPLTITCLAIEGKEPSDCALLISCDLTGIDPFLQEMVRRQLAERLPEVPQEKVVMTATHTHTSLVYAAGTYPHPGGEVMTEAECAELIASRAADAAEAAWHARAPQTITRAFGHAVVGHNRRAVYADGSAAMYGRTDREDFLWFEGYEDHSLDMLFFRDNAGRLTGLALAIPCPSQVDEHMEQFSADYWHDVRQELRARFGPELFLLPLCSAAGDQSPHFLCYGRQEEEMRNRRGVTERQEIAWRVADGVSRALACTPPEGAAQSFAHITRNVALPPREVSQVERDWAETARAEFMRINGTETWWPKLLRQVVEQFEGRYIPDPVPVELHALRLGDAALITNPFELYLDYAIRIKTRSAAAQTLTVQLAAGSGLYLPTARAIPGGGYSAMPAVCRVSPEGGRQLVEISLEMIQELFPKA